MGLGCAGPVVFALLLGFLAVETALGESLPRGFPKPIVPNNNPMSAQKAQLGALLFSDVRLSRNSTLACSSCHIPARYFTDGRARPLGALGDELPFNTPTLLNAAYSSSFSWVDKGFETLEQQHLGPLKNKAPLEMGLEQAQLDALSEDAELMVQLQRAFPGAEGFNERNVVFALATYIRTLIRGDSPFDRYLFEDDPKAMSQQAQAGLKLFTSSRLNCIGCHRGFLLSGPTQSARAQFEPSFYRTGVSGSELGLRVPSLRFLTQTAPYMHDGSLQTLQQVIDFYAAGGAANKGSRAAEKLNPFTLTAEEQNELIAFLRSL